MNQKKVNEKSYKNMFKVNPKDDAELGCRRGSWVQYSMGDSFFSNFGFKILDIKHIIEQLKQNNH
jgi:hypothetical protein